MIEIRRMTIDDVSLGMRLKEQAGWNQIEADWRRFLALEPDGCFVAELDGEPVATTTTCVFGTVAWIAMVLVDKPARHQGIATRLVDHAVQYLEDRGVETVRLDATPLGRPVYERLGFLAEYELVRLQGTVSTSVLDQSVALAAPMISVPRPSWTSGLAGPIGAGCWRRCSASDPMSHALCWTDQGPSDMRCFGPVRGRRRSARQRR